MASFDYDVLIVGSGLGGSVAALRAAEKGYRKIHLHKNTTLTPEQYIAGLTDFSPGRSAVFSKSADDYLKDHSVGETDADVTEGSGKTTDSNTWGGPSGYTYTFRPLPDGKPRWTSSSSGRGRTPKGDSWRWCSGASEKRVLAKAFSQRVEAIEVRDDAARAATG
jgi:choline dehydrogenase-like flavoprotein